ncbi:MFS transporter [Streptomyces sp. AV19]|uniref:MFS transporter n=1 Tax=Streptomyces sp. AV19 TaxID=2793068 RepID=UPI0018FE89F9|nr:MFS transporter [Streptomyces sp. AV19]MBH1938743.1 MFS transporter [Streptomyces sp. AV19]MDG4534003.1 MFS transporter [Streptomyces sp. AV19]
MEYLRLLRRGPVPVLWAARSLSVLGDRLHTVAVMWSVWAGTGSASLMGLVAILESAPYVVLGATGRRVVARFASYGALARVDAARAAVATALPFLWSPDAPGTAVVFAGVLALGTLGALFDPSLEALLPTLVEPGRVQAVTGLFDLTGRIARTTGHACAAALLLVFSKVELFAFVGAAFAVSSVTLAGMARRYDPVVPSAPGPRPAPAPDLPRARPRVGPGVLAHGALPFTAAATTVAMPALLAARHGAGAGVYGLITAAVGVGALIGNPVAGAWRPRTWLLVCCAAWGTDGVATACMGLTDHVPVLEPLSVLVGLAAPLGTVTLRARLGAFPPAERLRLMSVEHTAARAGSVTAILLLPPLADLSPPGAFVTAGAVVTALAAGAALLSRPLARRAGACGTVPGARAAAGAPPAGRFPAGDPGRQRA